MLVGGGGCRDDLNMGIHLVIFVKIYVEVDMIILFFLE